MDKNLIQQLLKDAMMVESSESNAKRLDRIEEKLDRLTDAMVAMARAEEKIIALQDDHENMRDRLNKLSVKLDEIQKAVDDNSRTVGIINKVVYVAVAAAIGTYVTHVWM
jgi:predicted  nucleic acid-binding Zn-ribbon protein